MTKTDIVKNPEGETNDGLKGDYQQNPPGNGVVGDLIWPAGGDDFFTHSQGRRAVPNWDPGPGSAKNGLSSARAAVSSPFPEKVTGHGDSAQEVGLIDRKSFRSKEDRGTPGAALRVGSQP